MAGARDELEGSFEAPIGDLRQVIDRAYEAFIEMDAGGFVTDWNGQAERTFGWSREEAVGQVLADLIIPERYRAPHLASLRRYLNTGEVAVLDRRLELSAIDRSGREFPVELTIALLGAPTTPRFCAFVHDISAHRLAERLLRAQSAITKVFAEAHSTSEAMSGLLAALGEAMDWQLGAWWSPAEGEVLVCRDVWSSASTDAPEFEHASQELELPRGVGLPGTVWLSGEPAWSADLAVDPSSPRANAAARAGLHAGLCVPVVSDREFRGAIEFFSTQPGEPDHTTRRILGTIASQIGGFVSLLDERSAMVAKLERLALTDELTGLANRRAWQESLGRELASASRHRRPLCVAMLDLDRFKDYNDAHGHQAGDRLLRELAQAWRRQLRASDILARYGGEEFSVVFSSCPIEHAESILERVRAATPEGQTCSAGLAAFNGTETEEELINRADTALYEAKAGGRDRTATAQADRTTGT